MMVPTCKITWSTFHIIPLKHPPLWRDDCQYALIMLRTNWMRGHAVAQLVEALLYKPEGRGIDSRCCFWNFLLTQSFRPHSGAGVDSASNRNEYQEYFLGGKGGRCVRLTNLPPSCADFLEIWKPQPPGTLRACTGLYKGCFTLCKLKDELMSGC